MTLQPLVGAIAAGNCAAIKPSDECPTTAWLLQKLITRYMDQRAIQVMTPTEVEMPEVYELKWDKIFFSGK